MTGRIRITPLAAESLGVRSMCTYIQTPDIRVLVDPGCSLGPRFGLLPHPREYACLAECRKKIAHFADKTDIITISHYHFDHSTPTYTDYVWNFSDFAAAKQIYREKTILAKNFRSRVNPSQRRRGWMLKRAINDHVKEFIPVDDKTLVIGDTLLRFSHPVPHGEVNTPLGWVLMLTVEHGGYRVVHASDVQGPISDSTLDTLIAENPNIVYLGGPPLYLLDYRISPSILEHAMRNAEKLVEKVPTVILDHHLLRAENWRETLNMVFTTAHRAGHSILTAASFVGKAENNLEPRRRSLYEDEPPSKAFNKWRKLPKERQRYNKPPI